MPGKRIQGILVDLATETGKEKNSCIRLFIKTRSGMESFIEKNFHPYFYAVFEGSFGELKKKILEKEFGEEKSKAIKAEKAEEYRENAARIYFKNTSDLVKAREEITKISGVMEKREHDIVFTRRYLIDKGLEPLGEVEVEFREGKEKEVQEIKRIEKKTGIAPVSSAFDLETYSGESFSNPKKDAILMAAFVSGKEKKVFTANKKAETKHVELVESESKLIERLVEEIREKKTDIMMTYNGDLFDLPYLRERASVLKAEIDFGVEGSGLKAKKHGFASAVMVVGMQHLDVYQLLRLFVRFGIVSLVKFDLESVVEQIYGEKKEKITAAQITESWDSGKGLEKVAEYNLEDAEQTYRLGNRFLPVAVELSKLVKQTLFDVSRGSAGFLVEFLLMDKCFQTKTLLPNRPHEGEVKKRMMQSFKGGFVKSPEPGLHENIAVLDFRSLHPSIMISHNVSPETLNCDCCRGNKKNLAPDGDYFCTKKKGFIPAILEQLLENRKKIKKEMKKFGKDSEEFEALSARQQALKILLNSFYGYLGYPRSRWYSLESARSVTAWSRHYVKDIGHKAEKAGFRLLYNDTDSAFLGLPKGKTKADVLEFAEKVNSGLPGVMELEFEGIYKRGLFVTRREGGAAKKRYALIDFRGNLSIVGFEYVRRDWARIAKDTQRRVLQAVLEEGKPEKAVQVVRKAVKDLKEGKVQKKDLVIISTVKKSIKSYESIGPHIAAAKKAIKRGKRIGVGTIIEYIVTRSGKSISDRAELAEFVQEGNYDADYYIEHQVFPAVIKIIRELGVSEEDLVQGGKQQTLGAFG